MIEYIRNLEAPINLEDLTRDIFQEVDDENINAVRVSLGRYILRERDYEFDVPPMYKKIKNSPMIEPIISPGDSMTPEISRFLEKIKKSVIKCDIILKAKAWRREFNVMHMGKLIPSHISGLKFFLKHGPFPVSASTIRRGSTARFSRLMRFYLARRNI